MHNAAAVCFEAILPSARRDVELHYSLSIGTRSTLPDDVTRPTAGKVLHTIMWHDNTRTIAVSRSPHWIGYGHARMAKCVLG